MAPADARTARAAKNNHSRYRRLKARVRRRDDLGDGTFRCHLCGRHGTYDDTNPKTRWSLDHIEPVATRPDLALDLDNAASAHRSCNARRRDQPLATYLADQQARTLTTSRTWLPT